MAFQKKVMKFKPVAKNCPFCADKTLPDYKEYKVLEKYVSERGKILSKARTGLCSKHQRIVTQEIKRSRYIGIMPFIVRA